VKVLILVSTGLLISSIAVSPESFAQGIPSLGKPTLPFKFGSSCVTDPRHDGTQAVTNVKYVAPEITYDDAVAGPQRSLWQVGVSQACLGGIVEPVIKIPTTASCSLTHTSGTGKFTGSRVVLQLICP
jgi:hypothetical protein